MKMRIRMRMMATYRIESKSSLTVFPPGTRGTTRFGANLVKSAMLVSVTGTN